MSEYLTVAALLDILADAAPESIVAIRCENGADPHPLTPYNVLGGKVAYLMIDSRADVDRRTGIVTEAQR
jgi:hypothetical protein